jgi:hypothetical protein
MRAAQLLHIMPVTGAGRWLTSPVEYTISPLALFNQEVVYPLRYTQWYNDKANGYDFACNEDLADLERIHPSLNLTLDLSHRKIHRTDPDSVQ